MSMKTFSLPVMTLILVVSLCLIGCSKDSSVKEEIEKESEVCNPFDFVGELHNQGLDAIYGNLIETKASSVSEDEIIKLANAFCDDVFSKDERFSVNIPYTKSGDYDYDETDEVTISEEVSNYIDVIMSVASTEDYDFIKEQFSVFEEDIILTKTSVYSVYEANLLLCSLAIGKYSNEYWNEYNVATKSAAGELVGADLGGAIVGIKRHALEILLCGVIGGVGSGLAAAGKAALGPALGASALAGLAIGMGELF